MHEICSSTESDKDGFHGHSLSIGASLPVGATGCNQEEEKALMKKFPPGPDFGVLENQFLRVATILLWVLFQRMLK